MADDRVRGRGGAGQLAGLDDGSSTLLHLQRRSHARRVKGVAIEWRGSVRDERRRREYRSDEFGMEPGVILDGFADGYLIRA